jgi:hypothetical protein
MYCFYTCRYSACLEVAIEVAPLDPNSGSKIESDGLSGSSQFPMSIFPVTYLPVT